MDEPRSWPSVPPLGDLEDRRAPACPHPYRGERQSLAKPSWSESSLDDFRPTSGSLAGGLCEIPQKTTKRSAIVPKLDQALIRKEVRHVLGVLRTGSQACRDCWLGRPPCPCRAGPRG